MTNIWIVKQSSGSCEDYRSWPVGAFPTKEEAEKWIVVNQALFLSDLAIQIEQAREYQNRVAELEEEYPYDWQQPNSSEYKANEEAFRLFHGEWEGKATSEPYEEWGYSLNRDPIPYYGPTPL